MPDNFHGCEICNVRAKWRFSPDLDIRGLGACQKHLEIVREGYRILLFLGIKEYKRYINAQIAKIKKEQKANESKATTNNPPTKPIRD